MIRNVILDWSGTLVDDLPAVWEATNHCLRQAGKPGMTLADFRAEFCLPFTRFYQKHLPAVPIAQLEEVVSRPVPPGAGLGRGTPARTRVP